MGSSFKMHNTKDFNQNYLKYFTKASAASVTVEPILKISYFPSFLSQSLILHWF